MEVVEKIKLMPKTELHIHTEGAIPPQLLLDLIKRKEPHHPISSLTDLNKKLTYTSFREFIMTWIWMVSYIQSEKDFETIIYHVLENLNSQNVKIAELFYSPFDYQNQKLDPAGITEFMISGVKKAKKDFRIHASLIADIVRNHTYEPAEKRFERIEKYLGDQLIGIGLGGSEDKFPNESFATVFRYAQSVGFKTVAHAGEAAGADSVRSAVEILKAHRIGHGIRIIEDQELVGQMKQSQIPFEVCPTSNIETQVVSAFDKHPIRKMVDAGLMITLSSDDPTLFRTSITNEFVRLANEKNFSWNEIKNLATNGVKASFLKKDQKEKYLHLFEKELSGLD